jgi:hypothetical protein
MRKYRARENAYILGEPSPKEGRILIEKAIKATIVVIVALILASCAPRVSGVSLVAWTTQGQEIADALDAYNADPAFMKKGMKIETVAMDISSFREKLQAAISAGSGVPDIVVISAEQTRECMESGALSGLSSLKKAVAEQTKYAREAASDSSGKPFALGFALYPGGFFYRRAIAEKYLGSSDPEKVQEMVKDMNAIFSTAKKLKEASAGEVHMTASWAELYYAFKDARKKPWVVDGKLEIDPLLLQFLKLSRSMRRNGYDAGVGLWSSEWIGSLQWHETEKTDDPYEAPGESPSNDEGYEQDMAEYGEAEEAGGETDMQAEETVQPQDEISTSEEKAETPPAERIKAFGYVLGSWGITLIGQQSSDWSVVQGPAPFVMGGVWLAVPAKSRSRKAAMGVIADLAGAKFSAAQCLRSWPKGLYCLPANADALESLAKEAHGPFVLSGYDTFPVFMKTILETNGRLINSKDPLFETLWLDVAKSYVVDRKSENATVESFKLTAKDMVSGPK